MRRWSIASKSPFQGLFSKLSCRVFAVCSGRSPGAATAGRPSVAATTRRVHSLIVAWWPRRLPALRHGRMEPIMPLRGAFALAFYLLREELLHLFHPAFCLGIVLPARLLIDGLQ